MTFQLELNTMNSFMFSLPQSLLYSLEVHFSCSHWNLCEISDVLIGTSVWFWLPGVLHSWSFAPKPACHDCQLAVLWKIQSWGHPWEMDIMIWGGGWNILFHFTVQAHTGALHFGSVTWSCCGNSSTCLLRIHKLRIIYECRSIDLDSWIKG